MIRQRRVPSLHFAPLAGGGRAESAGEGAELRARSSVLFTRGRSMFNLTELERAQEIVHAAMTPTAAHAWPLLAARLGTTVIVKHENHTPTGAFKVRGGGI